MSMMKRREDSENERDKKGNGEGKGGEKRREG